MVAKPESLGGDRLDLAIDDALGWLDEAQHPEGYWAGMLESNACMEAEWLLAFHIFGIEHPEREAIVAGILKRQREDGAWETFHDAPSGDINTTVESYTALRATGRPPDDPALERARGWILDHGGLSGVRVFTRYWLALLGEWPWRRTPNLPPEIVFLPRWMPFNIYDFASWARATLVPLTILSARRFSRPLAPGRRLDELFPEGRESFDYTLPGTHPTLSWERFFLGADRVLHALQRIGFTPGRETAIKRALEWIVRHQDADGAWGGIQPPWIYSLMALYCEGYAVDHPVMARGLATLDEHWGYERDGARYIQASESPVWDTLLSLAAMQDCGRNAMEHAGMRRAVDWILGKENRTRGDWSVKVRRALPGGWAFERANRHYPDLDDTAVALIALGRIAGEDAPPELHDALARARAWTLAMQSKNGGWAAFDKDNTRAIITRIPFCDFGEVLDPPSVDVTAHVVEGLAELGMTRDDPRIARALDYLRSEQEPSGSWFGRWGVNHVYGTGAVLPALAALGEDMGSGYILRAADWLVRHQNDDGGWGETCSSYVKPALIGHGSSTASQTAWALIGLLATDRQQYRDAIERGVGFLLERQRDGTWDEPHYTGAGFPGYGYGERQDLERIDAEKTFLQGEELARAFMINYNLYRHYFPVMALGRAQRALTLWGARED